MANITGLKPYKCPVCQKAFTQHANMVKHQMLHTGKCRSITTSINPSLLAIAIHYLLVPVHVSRFEVSNLWLAENLTPISLLAGLKPYKCPVCDKAFTQQANMVKHQMLHTGRSFKFGMYWVELHSVPSNKNFRITEIFSSGEYTNIRTSVSPIFSFQCFANLEKKTIENTPHPVFRSKTLQVFHVWQGICTAGKHGQASDASYR